MEKTSTWLMSYQSNVYSQEGEDGIIERILKTLPEQSMWCVEFGALDGIYLSNSRNLIEHRNYAAVLIEANRKFYNKLQSLYNSNNDVITINKFVGFNEEDSLDTILSETEIPVDYDFLSIDIDGNDYHVWKAASKYRPKVLCIEFNPTIPTEVYFVQAADPSVCQGSSISALVELGKEKGYELISVVGVNLFFIRAEYFPLFNIGDNSIATMRTNLDNITYIFSGYDGTILLSGLKKLPWHRLDIKEKKIQLLPAFLRNYPGNYNSFQLVLYGLILLIAKPHTFIERVKRFFNRNRH